MARTATTPPATRSASDGAAGALTDDDLLVRIGRGDDEAFTVLVERHLDPIHGYLQRMTGSNTQAEDLSQETFMRIWQRAGRYTPGKVRASTWIHKVAHNLCIDAFRKRQELTGEELERADDTADPLLLVSAQERTRRLEGAIATLPDNQRSAVLLCQIQGFSNAQAAEIMGVKVRALESLLARARRKLRRTLFSTEEDSP